MTVYADNIGDIGTHGATVFHIGSFFVPGVSWLRWGATTFGVVSIAGDIAKLARDDVVEGSSIMLAQYAGIMSTLMHEH